MSNHGLRGHETVIRLVGKRRKLTLSAISTGKLAACEAEEEGDCTSLGTSGDINAGLQIEIKSSSPSYHEKVFGSHATISEGNQSVYEQTSGNIQQGGVGTEKQESISWVQCPICSKSIRGVVINIHLDTCLQGGTTDKKRKSKQLTMQQFSASTCIGKVSIPISPAGLQRTTAEENQSFGSVKLEASVPSRPPEPASLSSQGRHHCVKETPNDFGRMKLENMEPFEPCQSVIFSPLGGDARQNRMKLKRRTTKVTGGKPNLCPMQVATSGEEAPELENLGETGVEAEELALDAKEQCMNASHGNKSRESMSSYHVSEPCSCNCHLVVLNGERTEGGSRDSFSVENQVSGERKHGFMVRAGEKTNSTDKVATGTVESSAAHSTEKLTDDGTLKEVLHTKIVGRRFNRGVVCKQGMKVTVVREPDNPKDPNAIKVVQSDNPGGLPLGHLSREISLHLSSLLDKGLVHISGSVTAVPEQKFGAVPIKLFCDSELSKEDFLKLDGAEDSLQKVLAAAGNLDTLPEHTSTSGSVSKYQQNFLFMLRTVLERDSHLFKNDELAILEAFSSLTDDAQRLFIRLYQRKGPWFRLSNLEYKDVGDVVKASDDLLAAGYMTAQDSPEEDPEIALRKRFEILSVMELQQFVCTALMKKKSEAAAIKKDELVKMAVTARFHKHINLIPEYPRQSGSSLIQMLADISGKCIRASDTVEFLLWRLKRLFFLNGDTDFSAFLVVDMGLVKYPRYRCWRARRIFESREALLAYEQALEIAQRMDMALESSDTVTALKLLETARHQMNFDDSNQPPAARTPTFLARFSASYVYKNVCTLGVSILERERRYFEAVDVLRQLLSSRTIKSGRWGYWTLRLSMDLDHLGRKEESLQIAEEGVSDPWIRGGDRVALQRRVVRLGKPPRRWKTPPYAAALKRNCKEVQIQGRPLNCVAGVRSWFYGYDGQQCRVEELALQYFASEEGGGWQGVHCEGGVWMTFFGLLMWDVLFSDVPDVFQTVFQAAPLDLDTEVFYSSRQSLIEAQLAAIAKGDTEKLLAQTWNRNMGTMCQGVNWERHSLEELQTIASCIGGPGLSTVCRLLAEDHAGWTAGMPDLLLWRIPTTSDSGLCTKCCCNLSVRATSVESRNLGSASTAKCSLQEEKKVEKGGGFIIESSNNLRRITGRQVRTRGEAKLVEVKGPRDRLSEQQRAWIWILMSAGLSVEVCKVLEDPTSEP